MRNVNRTKLACATDGRRYTIRGRLVGPRGAVTARRAPAATMYLHGLSFGRWLFNLRALPRYDYAAQQAKRGMVSLVIDRLGYDASGKPIGTGSCLGGQADIAHQIIGRLRSGRYQASRGGSPRFRRVVTAGHSVGGILVQLEAYSFRDVDGVAIIAYSDLGATTLAGTAAAQAVDVCNAGGQPADAPSGPAAYAFYGQTPQDFRSAVFATARPNVVAAGLQRRNRDPCGDLRTFQSAVATNLQHVDEIRVPVLVVSGALDPLFRPVGTRTQAGLLTGTDDVTTAIVPGASHAISLERTAPRFRNVMARWHRRHGFVTGTTR